MSLLALDIGTRHTGAAFYDPAVKIVMPLTTIEHTSEEELVTAVSEIVKKRHINRIFIGLPLLPSGKDGSQATIIRGIVVRLETLKIPCQLLDERYTTPKSRESDGDAQAACSLLNLALEKGI